MIRTLTATRYVTPLREGGSLPAVVEADDDGLYVLKFRGAGQGLKALIAELIAGEIGRALGLLVPEIVLMQLDPALGRSEPDFEIQALLKASAGLNLALDFLPGALPYNPITGPRDVSIVPALASAIVWFDAYISNPDRTARNTNMLIWHKRLWLIDHGAALYFHHAGDDYRARSASRFAPIKDHVLLPFASMLAEVDEALSRKLTPDLLREILAAIPDEWLGTGSSFATPDAQRAAYLDYLVSRLQAPRHFVEEAINARAQLL
ncbi:MAG: HipA family kinase [Ktedonobacterales bacterium]